MQRGPNDTIRTTLIPYVERISANVPQQYHQAIKNILSQLATDPNPMNVMQAFAEIRNLFAAFPHYVQEMDTMAQSHPILSMCYVHAMMAPQVYYMQDPHTGATMQVQGYGQGMPQQYIQVPTAALQQVAVRPPQQLQSTKKG